MDTFSGSKGIHKGYIYSIAFSIGKSSKSSKKVFTIRISKFHTEKALRFEPVNLNFFKTPFFNGMPMVLRLGSSAPIKKINSKRDYEIIEAFSVGEVCDSLYEFIESIPFGASFFFEDCIKDIGTSASQRKNLWPLYFPDVIFSGALVREKANLFRKIDLPKDLNPKVVIESLSYNDHRFMVARDDLLLGGTKQRIAEELFKLHPKGIIYPGPPTGYAQIALALGALKYGSDALILLPKVRPITPQTRLALQLGASIFEYEGEAGSLKNLKKEAEAFSRANDLYLPELGFSGSEFRDLMKPKLKEALEGFDVNSITDIWVAGGSGALAFTLHDFFPKAMMHVVQVGKQLDWYFGPISGNGKWSTVHIAKEKFSQKTMDPPPYPSLEEYDAKVWSFAKHHLSPTTLIWNVAGPPKNLNSEKIDTFSGSEDTKNKKESEMNVLMVQRSLYFRDVFSKELAKLLKINDKFIYKLRAKILSYNTLVLGLEGYDNNLIASENSEAWHYFIEDLRHNYQVDGDLAMEIKRLWRRISIQAQKTTDLPKIPYEDPIDIRYAYYGIGQEKTIQQGLCLSAEPIYQWILSSPEEIPKPESVLEAFAGQKNHNLPRWCSLFPDIETDSFGSFFKLEDFSGIELIISNPPYQTPVLEEASKRLVSLAEEGIASISIIPDWRSSKSKSIKNDWKINPDETPIPFTRQATPYPSFEILEKSPHYYGTVAFNGIPFQNFFSGGGKTLEKTNIILVILGSESLSGDTLVTSLLEFFSR